MNDQIQEVSNETKEQINTNVEEEHNPAFHLFLYLVSFLSLGFLVAGILISFFQAINKFIPDPLDDRYYNYVYFSNDAIKFGLSSLIVAIPIYFAILFLISRKLEKNEIDPSSLVRKFISYLALFVFAAMGIGSLISLLYNFFDGELTQKFLLKVIVFFIVSAFFFGFYFWEIRRKDLTKRHFMPFYLASLGFAVASMILGFVVIDSPKVARQKRLDQNVISTIKSKSTEVNGFYQNNKKLPDKKDIYIDPEDNIVYQQGEGTHFEICGIFLRQAEKGEERFNENEDWSHPAGGYCFLFDANREPYINDPIKINP